LPKLLYIFDVAGLGSPFLKGTFLGLVLEGFFCFAKTEKDMDLTCKTVTT